MRRFDLIFKVIQVGNLLKTIQTLIRLDVKKKINYSYFEAKHPGVIFLIFDKIFAEASYTKPLEFNPGVLEQD